MSSFSGSIFLQARICLILRRTLSEVYKLRTNMPISDYRNKQKKPQIFRLEAFIQVEGAGNISNIYDDLQAVMNAKHLIYGKTKI